MANDHQGKLMKVEIQSKKWIKPSTPTPSHLHKLNLSSIDQLQLPDFAPLLLHFDIGNGISEETPDDHERLARLEESLSKVLTLYYPFAGRYDEDDSAICCQDQGVGFVVASVDRKLNELVDGEYDKDVLLSGLRTLDIAWAPVVFVQVNIFTCGGLAIGLRFLRKVGEMFTFSTFMDAWATACRLGTLDDKMVGPSFSLSSLMPPKDYLKLSKLSVKPPETNYIEPLPKFVPKRYIFTGEAISKLRSSINIESAKSNTTTTKYYTRVEVVTALITKSLINVERSKGGKLRPLVISQQMNLRTRTLLPIEENSCGNLCTRLRAALDLEVENHDHEPWELREVAELIQNSIRNVASEIGKVGDWSELSQKVEKATLEFYEERKKPEEVKMVMFSSWCRFPFYQVDFGWGEPSLVSIIPLPFLFTCLMDYKGDEGGIEAWVNLEEHDMARFQQEPDILEYASTST